MAQKVQIVIHAAKNVPNRDGSWFTGVSDPYCVVSMPNKSEPLCRTKTINDNLNPVWNESFIVDYDGQSSLTFSVWDSDWGKEDDFLGTCVVTKKEILAGFKGSKNLTPGHQTKVRTGANITFKVIPSKQPCCCSGIL
mmetsp:Transcript_95162/g.269366  ORF Transcript_95162/g.269366 Transcript_95162/m.269366 type:complete len:138 (-) Transcript_95162:265-678(-)